MGRDGSAAKSYKFTKIWNQKTLKFQERVEAVVRSSLTKYKLGYRLMVGHQVLVLSIEVRVLVPQQHTFIDLSNKTRDFVLLGYRK